MLTKNHVVPSPISRLLIFHILGEKPEKESSYCALKILTEICKSVFIFERRR